MSAHCLWLKLIVKLVVLLMMGMSINTEAGWFGLGGDSWREEVLLHDGQKIIVKRSQSYGGRHEIGQSAPVKAHDLTFTMPSSNKAITWQDEYSEDVGHSNFDLLALHILNGTPYLVTAPFGCLAYNKWGRPNPPYVLFKHDGKAWQRIQMSEFPNLFKNINLVHDTLNNAAQLAKLGLVSVENVKKLNAGYPQPELNNILHETYPTAAGGCMEEVRTGDGWMSLDWFSSQKTYEACLKVCERNKVSVQNCPCSKLFKGK